MSGNPPQASSAPPDPGSEASDGEDGCHGFPAHTSETSQGGQGGVVRCQSGLKRARPWSNVSVLPTPSDPGSKMSQIAMGTKMKLRSGSKTSTIAATDGSSAAPAAPSSTSSILSTRPRIPPYPTTGKEEDLIKWQKECASIRKIWASDPDNNLPTRMGPKAKDLDTVRAVHSLPDKAVVLRAARSIVSVSSSVSTARQDGFRGAQCTGIIIEKWEEPDVGTGQQSYLIVTCSKIVCVDCKLVDPIPKISVVLPNRETMDVQLKHVIDHYDIVILSISLDFPLELPSIGRDPDYGEEVFVLARDRESSLMARRGEIRWLEESDYLGRNYYMFLTCNLPKGGNGGQLIDHDGNTRGMTFYLNPYPVVLSISTIITCVHMFMSFNRIARPMLDLGLRTVAFMDVQKQDVLSHKYGITHGFIVDTVPCDSDAEKLGFRPGNVILSFGDRGNLTLPELENYLLSLGLNHLKGNKKGSMIRLKGIGSHITKS